MQKFNPRSKSTWVSVFHTADWSVSRVTTPPSCSSNTASTFAGCACRFTGVPLRCSSSVIASNSKMPNRTRLFEVVFPTDGDDAVEMRGRQLRPALIVPDRAPSGPRLTLQSRAMRAKSASDFQPQIPYFRRCGSLRDDPERTCARSGLHDPPWGGGERPAIAFEHDLKQIAGLMLCTSAQPWNGRAEEPEESSSPRRLEKRSRSE